MHFIQKLLFIFVGLWARAYAQGDQWPTFIQQQEAKIAKVQAQRYALEFKNTEVARCPPSLRAYAMAKGLVYKGSSGHYNLDPQHAEDIKQWFSLQHKEKRIINHTQRQIKNEGIWSREFMQKDAQGKTALNYCKTRDIYNTMREHGAPFQWDAFLYINRYIIGTFSAVSAACLLCMNLYSAKKS